MKSLLRYVLMITGLASVFIFCVSAATAVSGTEATIQPPLSEPMNMLLLGLGLIGVGSLIKSRLYR